MSKVLATGTYQIRNGNTGQWINLPAGGGTGTVVLLSNGLGGANDAWNFAPSAEKGWIIQSYDSGDFLSVNSSNQVVTSSTPYYWNVFKPTNAIANSVPYSYFLQSASTQYVLGTITQDINVPVQYEAESDNDNRQFWQLITTSVFDA
ncbi:uncharacterized protein FIBRA_05880 [Fibroporia radiculosa]|uniref:Ricin B lectin domain-containing protein n=1 Tax=Fibroporia radiculosa TaxID=599839 RepID=J4H3S1_9APHY|nr:uncharacterized protein FIBRA_05880 [Fibroporia radiculosa]CCM03734.1 predicted protein [Fibroporia radiculosa]